LPFTLYIKKDVATFWQFKTVETFYPIKCKILLYCIVNQKLKKYIDTYQDLQIKLLYLRKQRVFVFFIQEFNILRECFKYNTVQKSQQRNLIKYITL